MLNISDFSLLSITPDSLKYDTDINAIIRALDNELELITQAISQNGIIWNIDNQPQNVIDLLAAQFHADFYDLANDNQSRIDTVKNSILWHMHKGTSWAIIQALKLIGVDAEFLHWKDTGDEPYTFRISAKITGDYYRTTGRDKIISLIRRVINDSKAARSVLKELDTKIEFHEDLGLFTASYNFLGGTESIKPALPEKTHGANLYYFPVSALQGVKYIYPDRINCVDNIIYSGVIKHETISLDLGCDLHLMQELLRQFENRIMNALTNHTEAINLRLKEYSDEVNLRLDTIEDLLRWKGDDEEL